MISLIVNCKYYILLDNFVTLFVWFVPSTLLYFRVSKSTAKTCENLKPWRHYFLRSLQKTEKQQNSITNLADFSFPFNQGGESQRAKQGVAKYFTTAWCWSTALCQTVPADGTTALWLRPGSRTTCTVGSGYTLRLRLRFSTFTVFRRLKWIFAHETLSLLSYHYQVFEGSESDENGDAAGEGSSIYWHAYCTL